MKVLRLLRLEPSATDPVIEGKLLQKVEQTKVRPVIECIAGMPSKGRGHGELICCFSLDMGIPDKEGLVQFGGIRMKVPEGTLLPNAYLSFWLWSDRPWIRIQVYNCMHISELIGKYERLGAAKTQCYVRKVLQQHLAYKIEKHRLMLNTCQAARTVLRQK